MSPLDLAGLFSWPAAAGVLLAGSFAEGVAMRGSNVNVIVVDAPRGWAPTVDGHPPTPRQAPQHPVVQRPVVLRPMTLADNHIVDLDPTIVSIDVLRPDRLHDLAALASGMAMVADPRTPDLSLPVLDVLEIRLLARLRSGRVLYGADTVDRWRERLALYWLPAFHCATTYLAGVHFHGKAVTAHRDGMPVDAAVLLRLAVEHLLIAALAADGRVLHEVKNLGRTVAASLSTWAPPPRVLAEAATLLGRGLRGEPELLALVDDLAADLLDRLPTARYGPVAAAYLHGQHGQHGRTEGSNHR